MMPKQRITSEGSRIHHGQKGVQPMDGKAGKQEEDIVDISHSPEMSAEEYILWKGKRGPDDRSKKG